MPLFSSLDSLDETSEAGQIFEQNSDCGECRLGLEVPNPTQVLTYRISSLEQSRSGFARSRNLSNLSGSAESD
ncbi:hypothetical protein GJ744_001370 [Endocarpon pusillum]|uniref:Uncharacterized protein n=1 Tax=Endocarpon pusillum TaxID=364733 RepID=A0A8H7AWJ8_9EURO|nr:hypothetical protein GJ744_001370 [Endocarpon pusillum]